MAQDIFTSGYFINASGLKTAAVFKNGEVIFKRAEAGRDFFSSAMVIDTVNGDIYWSCNTNPVNSISEGYGHVMKNEEFFFNNELGTQVNAIAFDGEDLYSAGYINDVYQSVAAVWKNGEATPLYTYGSEGKRSEVLGLEVVDGVVYACGYYENNVRYGCVWVNGELYACYPYNIVTDIDYYNGELYYAVGEVTFSIYKSGQELYELFDNDGTANTVCDIEVVDDDVYSVGFMGFNDCFVWKNADFLYIHPFGREANFNACYSYGQSLYYVGWDHEYRGIIFKDGEQLYSLESRCFYDVFVKSDPFAVDEENKGTLVIYPNPVRESLSIDNIDEGDVIGVFNTLGQLVKSVKADSGRKIDVRGLSPGFYWIRCGHKVMPFVKE